MHYIILYKSLNQSLSSHSLKYNLRQSKHLLIFIIFAFYGIHFKIFKNSKMKLVNFS